MPPPLATVSVDVDPLDLHLEGYGIVGAPPDDLVYARALPRLLALLGEAGVRGTFFFVARDLPRQATAVETVHRAGHEVASHSLTHPLPFRKLAPEAFRREIVESKRRLESACGAPVVGFRAPNWDLTERELPSLAEAGYRYDASSYPSPWLLAARAVLALKAAGGPRAFFALTKLPPRWSRAPYRWHAEGREMIVFPLATSGPTRFPLYQTVLWGRSDEALARAFEARAREGAPLSFALHALDALGAAEDGLDPRLARHPGMGLGLEGKLASLGRTFRAIAARFECVPFRVQLERGAGR